MNSISPILIFCTFPILSAHAAMTFDSYTDNIHHRSYNTYTYHYIDDDWNLKSTVLKTSLMESAHTAQNICDDYQRVIKEHAIQDKKVIKVTDSAANMVCACTWIGGHRVPCIAHKTNLLVQKDMMQDESIKEIPALLAKIREGQSKLMYKFDELREIKDKENQNQMAMLLHELCEVNEIVDAESQYPNVDDAIRDFDRNGFSGLKTLSNIRWGCVYKMATAYKNNSSIIKTALERLEKYDLILNRREMVLLSGVIELLDIFNVFTTFIQANSYPTMNTFVLFYAEIRDRLDQTIEINQDAIIVRAAEILRKNLDKRLPLTCEFIGAALIDPQMQRLPIIQEWLDRNGTFTIIIAFQYVR